MTERDTFEARLHAAVRGYVGRVSSDLDPLELARRIAAAEPRRHGLAASLRWRGVATPRRTWVLLLLAVLLAAMAGTALVASRLLQTLPPPRLSAALVPTGIDVLTPHGWYTRVVADGDGVLWAREEDGRLVRFDPTTGSGQTWTVSDDAAFATTDFATTDIASARAGGVWLVGARTLRWFDGAVFRQVIDAPAEIRIAVEGPDGGVWAATTAGAVLHWDGSSWSRLDPGRSYWNADINAIAVDAAGGVWCGSGGGWVSRYDGSTWRVFDAKDAIPLGGTPRTVAALPDGSIWVATSAGLARFDGSTWTDFTSTEPRLFGVSSVARAPDGSTWVAGGGTLDGALSVARFDGRTWTFFGSAEGLPDPRVSGREDGWIVPTKDRVLVGTGIGIYALSDGRWERAWPTDLSAPPNLRHLLAVSREELWAVGDGGAWHFQNGTWTNEPIDPSLPTYEPDDLTLAPDGTPWAAGADGITYRRNGHWVIADASAASAIVVDRDGTVWAGGFSELNGIGCKVWTLRFDGTAWVRNAIIGCPIRFASSPGSLAIDATGALWAGQSAGWMPGGLARFDGRSWETITELGGSAIDGATILGTTPGGETWVAATMPQEVGGRRVVARFDGKGWTIVDPPYYAFSGPDGRSGDLVMAPDGTLWASTWDSPSAGLARGLARYDGQGWTFPYAGTSLPMMGLASVAPDGTLFGGIGASIVRLPPQPARP